MEQAQPRAGMIYWIITVVGLLWNAFGCVDYVMTETHNAAYLAQLPADQLAYVYGLPAWVHGAWAIGVWFSLLGSILMLVRSRWAVPAFGLSLLGLAASMVYQVSTGMPASMTMPAMIGIQVAIWVVLIFLIWYTRRCREQGILR
ncbi:hypothetical protein [Sphingobium nicotianae]|uniref:Sugar transporter n=1 Tax=Sphingobium nicotianae TaxID=2782607 RepID=A0A9X1AIB3_9SPHN|nr:hypothetical protein [Sphingobium nicotianae]MBT2185861.1 hypothetical protein [Sphingobium nicotianae]